MEIEPTLSEKFTTGKNAPHISDKVEVGDMCAFKKKKTFKLERFFNSATKYYEEKVSEYQYRGTFAQKKQAELGVLCTWFQDLIKCAGVPL